MEVFKIKEKKFEPTPILLCIPNDNNNYTIIGVVSN
jgi:hypothetical protein